MANETHARAGERVIVFTRFPEVLRDSLAALGGCQPALLRTLADVNQVEDLEAGLRELEAREPG